MWLKHFFQVLHSGRETSACFYELSEMLVNFFLCLSGRLVQVRSRRWRLKKKKKTRRRRKMKMRYGYTICGCSFTTNIEITPGLYIDKAVMSLLLVGTYFR